MARGANPDRARITFKISAFNISASRISGFRIKAIPNYRIYHRATKDYET